MKVMKITLTLLVLFVLLPLMAFAQNEQEETVPLLKYNNFEKDVDRNAWSVAYSPDGEVLASGGNNEKVELWHVSDGSLIQTLDGHSDSVNTIAFSPDTPHGSWIASGGNDGIGIFNPDGKVVLWRMNGEEWVKHQDLRIEVDGNLFTKPFNNNIYSVAFYYDEDTENLILACGTSGDDVFVSSYDSNNWLAPKKLEGHQHDVNSVTFNSEGLLASGSTDGWVLLWDTDTESIVQSLWAEGHEEAVNSVAFSPNGEFLASGGNDDKIIFWKKDDNGGYSHHHTIDHLHKNDVRSVAFTPDGAVLVSADADGMIGVSYPDTDLDTEDPQAIVSAYLLPFSGAPLNSVAVGSLNPDHNYMALASTGNDNKVRQLAFDIKAPADSSVELTVPENLISHVAFGKNKRATDNETTYATYFILNAQFLTLTGSVEDSNGIYDECYITLEIDGVPEEPVYENPFRALQRNIGVNLIPIDLSDEAGKERLDNPIYFMHSLKTPNERLIELEGRRDSLLSTVGSVINKKILVLQPLKYILKFFNYLDDSVVPYTHAPAKIFTGAIAKVKAANIYLTMAAITIRFLQNEYNLLRWTRAEADAIFESTADPVIYVSSNGDGPGRPDVEDRYLFLVQKPLTDIEITVRQTFRVKSEEAIGFGHRKPGPTYAASSSPFTLNLKDIWQKENGGQGAPSARPISLSDYPPFQQLPPEVQEYLLRYFGESVSERDATDWQIPEETSLLPNYPNPFNPETWLPYQLSEPAAVTVTIYDIQGRVVRALDLGHQRAGIYHSRSRAAHWDGRNAVGEPVASGLYFYTLEADTFTATRKMLIRK